MYAFKDVFVVYVMYKLSYRFAHQPRFAHLRPLKAFIDYENVRPVIQTNNNGGGLFASNPAPPIEIAYSDFIQEMEHGGINKVEISQNALELRAYTPVSDEVPMHVALPEHNDIVAQLLKHHVKVLVRRPIAQFDIGTMFLYAFQFLIFVIMLRMLFGGMAGGGGNPFKSMVDSNARLDENPQTGVTFNDVAGCDNAKRDLKETVDFLKQPDKYISLGAKMPKGVLLVGPPGTGKTKLAKAVAGEAGVPFFSCSGSEFIEMFVGVGSARIRSLFKRAGEKSPCIIFIDEIDAIGKKRGNNVFGGHEEHDQTINQLLTLMDGFTPTEGVVVIAATNRPEILDEALLRPGRFDRQVVVDLPDIDGRRQILDIYFKGKPISETVSTSKLAKITVGFSGAELENLCNEACIYAARRDSKIIQDCDFDMAMEKLTIGEERNSNLFDEKKRRIIAYHEAGHAVIGLALNDFDKVRKISIVPRGSAGGVTYFEPLTELNLVSRSYLENQIMVCLGGRIAEELIFEDGEVTNGATNDFMRVSQIAQEMVVHFGFGNLPPMSYSDHDLLSTEVEREVGILVDGLYEKAYNIILENEDVLHMIASDLLEKETLQEDDIAVYAEFLSAYK